MPAAHEPNPDETRAAAAGDPPRKLETLKKRADFLACARAARAHAAGLILQGRRRPEPGCPAIRVGFTCSKKVGSAVTRNRAKRRLREAARAVLAGAGQPGWDYVLVGRPGVTVERPFAALVSDLEAALGKLHREPRI